MQCTRKDYTSSLDGELKCGECYRSLG